MPSDDDAIYLLREVSDTFWCEHGKNNTGLLDAMVEVRNLLLRRSGIEPDWVCSRCGKPASLKDGIWRHKFTRDMAGSGPGHDVIPTVDHRADHS